MDDLKAKGPKIAESARLKSLLAAQKLKARGHEFGVIAKEKGLEMFDTAKIKQK